MIIYIVFIYSAFSIGDTGVCGVSGGVWGLGEGWEGDGWSSVSMST